MKNRLFTTYNLSLTFELFLENKLFPFYSNKIKNRLTSKKIYPILPILASSSHQIYIIKDVPDYLKINPIIPCDLSLKKIKQYNGYLVNLRGYTTAQNYLSDRLSKRNIKNLFSKQLKLHSAHKISYKVFYGEISKKEYDRIFDRFYILLKKRFDEKKVYNKNLLKWGHLYKESYSKIKKKKASLFVIHDAGKPITITINFHLGDIVFSHIQTYDISYSKYNMGDISMLKHLEWCIQNKFSVFDLSMGQTDYKKKWCNHIYNFEYHLYYRNNPPSKLYITYLRNLLLLKQLLRNKKVIGNLFEYDRFFYRKRSQKLKNYNWKDTLEH